MKDKQKRPREIEIDIFPLFRAILSKLWIMLLVGLIVGLTFFGAAKLFIKPTYRSSFSAYINNQHAQESKDTLTYSDLSAAQQLTRTYSYMLQSSSVLTAAALSIGSDLPYSQLKTHVSTEIQNETEIIIVHVVDNNPEFAYEFATAISKTAPNYIAEFVDGSSMKIIDPPVLDNNRFGPSYVKYGLFGFLAGFLVVLAIVMILFFRDDKIKSEQDLEDRFEVPILGVIPDSVQTINNGKGYENNYAYKYGGEKE